MMFRSIDIEGDWNIGKGKSDFFRDMDALKANIRTRIKSWRGDCFFSPGSGVDYNNLLDVGTKTLLDNDIKRVILQSDGVIKILSFASEINNRGYEATCQVRTVYGNIELGV